MKLNKLKQILALFFIVSLFFLSASFVLANDVQKRGLEIKYPIINGIEITATSTIGTYAVYLFSVAMIIGAILAFAVLIFGGFRYLTSAGNPLAMAEAKKWIWGAILGLILLLCSWLIIGIINKELLTPKVPDIEAISGIYLVDKDNVKIPYSGPRVESIPEYFEVDHIEFISDKPEDILYDDPDKDELCSVYIYDEKGLEGEAREEIKNTGAETKHDVNNVGSMFLLWHEPGVYLYKEEGYDKQFNNPPRPKFIQTSQASFKEDFDNKIKSLRIVDDLSSKSSDSGPYYYVVLFEEPNFNKDSKGECGVRFSSAPPIGDLKISSIAIFKTAEMHGEVIFYDEINQKGNAFPQDLTGHYNITVILAYTEKEGVKTWNSIAINANATVVLCTKEYVLLGGYCRLFSPLGHDGDNLKTTSIYHKCYGAADCEEYQPKQAFIIPRQE